MNLARLGFETASNSALECLRRDAPLYRSVPITETDDRLEVLRRKAGSLASCRPCGRSSRSTATTAPPRRRSVSKGVLEA
jgi:hypothetical protein